jgi:hypothetical protein
MASLTCAAQADPIMGTITLSAGTGPVSAQVPYSFNLSGWSMDPIGNSNVTPFPVDLSTLPKNLPLASN